MKILTIGDNEEVLKHTIEASPRPPKIISRVPTRFPNNYVLDPNFKSKAKHKGKQLEWARKKYPLDYTLYLDEDSICSPNMNEIPDADIVQFNETPISDNWLIKSIEAYRLGYQIEQASFEITGPFYLWGGGFAIKRWLEDLITWDRDSITEDTAFVFYLPKNAKFFFSTQRIYNQAPTSLKALFKQRMRWSSGVLSFIRFHPDWRHRTWIAFRTVYWGLWFVFFPLFIFLIPYHWIFMLPLLQNMIWSFMGAGVMKLEWHWTLLAIIISPISGILHSFGAFIALFYRVKTFNVTPKEISH